jgi:tetratricopeptide (TPR) repeat protein
VHALAFVLLVAAAVPAATSAPVAGASAMASPSSGKTLVLPPEPMGDPGVSAWLAEAVADVLPRDLERLGQPAIARDDRLRAHETLGVPAVALSRATSIRFAETLGVSRLVGGTFQCQGHELTLSLWWLDVARGSISAPLLSKGALEDALTLIHQAAWDLALAGPSKPGGTRDAFLASSRRVPFPAFEAYGMGLFAAKPPIQIENLRRALKLVPEYDEARLALAQVEIEARDYASAQATLAVVPESSPLARAARFWQGVALLEMARYDEARALQARLAESEASPGVLSNQALAVLRPNVAGAGAAAGKASDLLRAAVDKAPGVSDLAFNLGWALFVEGDPEAAIFWLRGVARQAPRDATARVVLSWALRKAGHTTEAAEEWRGLAFTGAPDRLTDTPDLQRRLGRVMFAEWPLAVERSDVELAAAHVGRADALLRSNDADGALRELTRAAYLDPYSARAHALLATAHLSRGEKEKAVSELQMALWCDDDSEVRLRLVRLLAEMGRSAEARTEAEKVLKADPDNEAARAFLK